MQFLNDGTSSMPEGVTDAYNQLKRDLNKLRSDLNSSEHKNHPAVTQCCTVIHQLIAETYARYLELVTVHETTDA